MHDTGCLGLVHWDDPEGLYGEGSGRGVQDWEKVYRIGKFCGGFMLMYGAKPIQYCKVKKKNVICSQGGGATLRAVVRKDLYQSE